MNKILKYAGAVMAAALILTGCSSVSDVSNASKNESTYSSTVSDISSSGNLFSEAYSEAVSEHYSLKNELIAKISAAKEVLNETTQDMLDGTGYLEALENCVDEAENFLNSNTLSAGSATDDVTAESVDEVISTNSKISEYTYSITILMNNVEESRQRYKDTHKSEIILCNIISGYPSYYEFFSINPDSGEKTKISTFKLSQRVTSNNTGRKWWNFLSNVGLSKFAPLKGMASADYKYLACTRYAEDTGEYHAGWYDEDNRYYDVTEFTDSVKGDFEEPVQQIAIGFTDDGHFVFAEIPKKDFFLVGGYHTFSSEWKVYQVDVSTNRSAVKNSMKPYSGVADLQGDGWDWLGENCEVTDWIDSDHCIINYPEEVSYSKIKRWGVRLLDKTTGEAASFIPGEVRTNWSGVVSPDGKSVAFLSAGEYTGDASVYYVSIDGGNPIKLCDGISMGRTLNSNVPSRLNNVDTVYGNADYAFLLDWT